MGERAGAADEIYAHPGAQEIGVAGRDARVHPAFFFPQYRADQAEIKRGGLNFMPS